MLLLIAFSPFVFFELEPAIPASPASSFGLWLLTFLPPPAYLFDFGR
jgi:hypothetical protein